MNGASCGREDAHASAKRNARQIDVMHRQGYISIGGLARDANIHLRSRPITANVINPGWNSGQRRPANTTRCRPTVPRPPPSLNAIKILHSVPAALRFARLPPGSFGFAEPSPGSVLLENRLKNMGGEILSPHNTGNSAGRESATQCGAICR